MFFYTIYFWGVALTTVLSQNVSVPWEYFCTRTGHSSTVIDDAIYVFGGVRDLPYSRAEQWYDSALAKISLSKSWDYILDDSVITALGSHSVSDGPPPFLMYSTITYDSNGGIYIEGGARAIFNTTSNVSTTHPMPIGSPAENASWSLSKTDRFWKPLMRTITESSLFRTQILYTQAPDQNLIFYLNGILSNGSNERVYPKMTIINTRTNSSRTVSTEIISPSGVRVGAAFQYLPLLGQKGGLVLLGGATRHDEIITTDPWGTMESLGTIHVFDIASLDDTPNGVWYQQPTGGRTPVSRLSTCAVNILSPDRTSYHIYLACGRSPAQILHDVWILSLPQFQWTQVFTGTRPSYGATCQLVGKKQMLMLGGTEASSSSCDRKDQVWVWDLTNLKWIRSYEKDDDDFRIPKAVWERIGGSAMGESNMTEPEDSFSSIGLAKMFDKMAGYKEERSEGSQAERLTILAVVIWVFCISYFLIL
ncbi:hypothetical protein HBH69_242490 [Parastagonospora nodorum]|nr:hypothetical protein HBH69_242490 [Parastagonospora nodorum]